MGSAAPNAHRDIRPLKCVHIETVEVIGDDSLVERHVSSTTKDVEVRRTILVNLQRPGEETVECWVFCPLDSLDNTTGRVLDLKKHRIRERATPAGMRNMDLP